jgi:hypothetical protein
LDLRARVGRYRKLAVTLSIAASTLSASTDVCAQDYGYGAVAYGLVVIGGITTSAGMQVNLVRGEPDRDWAVAGAIFGGINAAFGAGWLIASGFVEEESTLLASIGGSHFAIAVANTALGIATIIADDQAAEPAIRESTVLSTQIPVLHYQTHF